MTAPQEAAIEESRKVSFAGKVDLEVDVFTRLELGWVVRSYDRNATAPRYQKYSNVAAFRWAN